MYIEHIHLTVGVWFRPITSVQLIYSTVELCVYQNDNKFVCQIDIHNLEVSLRPLDLYELLLMMMQQKCHLSKLVDN